jgi:hypothetical protein
MSQAPTLNGQVIGQTERATRALLDVLLAETDTAFQSWVSLNLIATNGEMATDALIDRLVTGLFITETDARSVVDRARNAGLVSGTATLRLTGDGRTRYEQIQAGVDAIARRLYSGLPHDDLVTARRVLETLTDRARAELAPRQA